ncbi:hypothetical protein HanRHA438_Chr02g0082571 [Helianthus annuus]|nr:hypothetical protein HanRHA438_Chr02g0082571 [Helianthus annuus]
MCLIVASSQLLFGSLFRFGVRRPQYSLFSFSCKRVIMGQKSKRRFLMGLSKLFFWSVWKAQNAVIFEGKLAVMASVIEEIKVATNQPTHHPFQPPSPPSIRCFGTSTAIKQIKEVARPPS